MEPCANEIKFIDFKGVNNFYNSQFAVVELRCFAKYFYLKTPVAYQEMSTYSNFLPSTVVIEFIGSKDKGVDAEQMRAVANLIANEERLAVGVRDAIYAYYKGSREHYLHGVQGMASDQEIADWFPEIIMGNELDAKIRLGFVLVYPPDVKGCKLDLRFFWSVDAKDVGVVIRGNEIIGVGPDLDML